MTSITPQKALINITKQKYFIPIFLLTVFIFQGCAISKQSTAPIGEEEGTIIKTDKITGETTVQKVDVKDKPTTDEITNQIQTYCDIKREFNFHDKTYKIAWSNQDEINGVKMYTMEFTPGDERVERYYHLITLRCIEDDNLSVEQAVGGLISVLQEAEKENPITKFEVFRNENEDTFIIDSLLPVDDSLSAIEWNLYTYSPLQKLNGRKGIFQAIFGLRAYDSDGNLKDFMENLQQTREEYSKDWLSIDQKQLFFLEDND